MEIDFKNGAAFDTRSELEKKKDFSQREIVAAAAPVSWVEKPQNEWRTFPDRNQNGSGSCVAQTVAKTAGVLHFQQEGEFLEFSATSIYQPRSNKPGAGMIGVEAFEIWRNSGISLESLVPSQNLSDSGMDSQVIKPYEKQIGEIFKTKNHVGLPITDFDTLASTLQVTKKGIMVWFYFTSAEWSKLIPTVDGQLDLGLESTLKHSVTAIDAFTYQGQQVVLIEDSAHFGGLTRRLITRDFYQKRNWFARYPMNFIFDIMSPMPQPHYTFTKKLTYEMEDPDIKALQDILKYEAIFPINVDSTGRWLSITAKAVREWQLKHGITDYAEEPDVTKITFGNKSIAKANELYAN